MPKSTRYDVDEGWAYSGMEEAGDFVLISYYVGAIARPIAKVIRLFDHLEAQLSSAGLGLQSVVTLDALFTEVCPLWKSIKRTTSW